MKKIILVSLFFCLAITTVLAQITPDGTTATSTSDVSGVTVIDIARPDANGLSNNSYTDFNILNSGVVFNNSDSTGDSQLAGSILANSNYTSGNSANLILHQVYGSNTSSLRGKAEVFGTEAAVIIANPNGISCDACGFVNASKVDLVTGTSNFSGDDLTGFSIDGSSTLTVSGSGFLSDAVADELNLTSRYLRINAQAKANNTLRVLSGNETYDHTTNIINSDDTETSGPHSIWIRGALEANYIELINTELDTDGVYGIVNHGGDISADRLRLDSNGLFNNQNDGSINISGLVEVTNAKKFTNNANITADTLTFSIAGDFKYAGSGNIAANNHYFTIRNGNFNNAVSIVTGNFGVTADRIEINSPVTANNFNATAGDSFYHDSGTINAKNFNVTVEKSFVNVAPINADNFNVTVGERFVNYSDVISDIISISAESFINVTTPPLAFAEGTISADTFALSITGNFDYSSDFLNNGNITTNALNLQVGGDFSNNDSASNFTWATNDNLAVLGNADITTDNYIQNGAIDVAGVLTITANNFTYTRPNNDFVLAENDSLSILGDFTVATNNFNNSGSITTDSLNITAGYTAINQGSIVSGSLDLTTDDFFRNLTGGDISVDSLNITAGGKVTNTATIDVSGILSITANNDSTRTDDPAGAFFYVSNRGNITAGSFIIDAVDNFYNRGNITTTSNFTTTSSFTTSAKSVFLLNEEIDSFVGTYTGGTITLGGTSGLITDGGIIENYGNIDLGSNILDISADSFTNHANANVTADTLNLVVSSFINDGIINATIDAAIINDTTTD